MAAMPNGLRAKRNREHEEATKSLALTSPVAATSFARFLASRIALTTVGVADAIALPDGISFGQEIEIHHVVRGSGTGTGRITAGASVHLADAVATITLTAVRDWVKLRWVNSPAATPVAGWEVIGWGGSVVFT